MMQQLLRKIRGDRIDKNTISLKTMQQLRKNMKQYNIQEEQSMSETKRIDTQNSGYK